MIKITFPDNSVKEYAEGTTAMQIAESISSRLAQEVLAASVNGEIWDLTVRLTRTQLSSFSSGKTRKVNMHSGTRVPT